MFWMKKDREGGSFAALLMVVCLILVCAIASYARPFSPADRANFNADQATGLVAADIGVNVQAYDADLSNLAARNAKDMTNIPPTGVVGTSLIQSDIGSSVQAYDADLDNLAARNAKDMTNIPPAGVVGTSMVHSDYTGEGIVLVGTGAGTFRAEYEKSGTCTNGETVSFGGVTTVLAVHLTYAENPGDSTNVNIALYPTSVATNSFVCVGVPAKSVYYTVKGVK